MRCSRKPRSCWEWVWPTPPLERHILSGLHAAQALIFERTGKTLRRHRGVQNELHRLTQHEPSFDTELRGFLSRTYNLKAIADYETGPDPEITSEQAQQAIAAATRFVDAIAELLET